MKDWLTLLIDILGQHGAVVRVTVVDTKGSVPREAGASMLVSLRETEGTIGGGNLEYQAIAAAHRMLHGAAVLPDRWRRATQSYALGPSLGQCCGGFVRLAFEVLTLRDVDDLRNLVQLARNKAMIVRRLETGYPFEVVNDRSEVDCWPLNVAQVLKRVFSGSEPAGFAYVKDAGGGEGWLIEEVATPRVPLYIYGAGHVGRAIVRIVDGLPFYIEWIDTDADRFPQSVPSHVKALVQPDPSVVARTAVPDALHLVLTYSHALDLAICCTLLQRNDFAFLGLIGSTTKKARFKKRLLDVGIPPNVFHRLTSPIGINGIRGKQPISIAISVAAQLVQLLEGKLAKPITVDCVGQESLGDRQRRHTPSHPSRPMESRQA